MATISIYAAKHAEKAHIYEFFLRNLLRSSERPIAIFDGFFYEAKHERVGGLSFQDYLVFSDKSVYFWARGAQKDYLDRFELGAVSFTSKQKDKEISTLNITVNRKGKDPVFLIFDLVPSEDAEKIIMLHVLVETMLEEQIGKDYWGEIPDDVAEKIFEIGMETCPPSQIELIEPQQSYQQPPTTGSPFSSPSGMGFQPSQNPFGSMFGGGGGNSGGSIGYGQNLLEQYKAANAFSGYRDTQSPGQQQQPQPRPAQNPNPFQQQPFMGRPPIEDPRPNFNRQDNRQDVPNNFGPEAFGPMGPISQITGSLSEIDVVTLKRMGALVKDLVSSIPEEYREQAKIDLKKIPENLEKLPDNLQQLPSNLAETINALNELLDNVSSNKQTQDFIIRAISAAVKNDGLVGAASKFMKIILPSGGSQGSSGSGRQQQASRQPQHQQPRASEDVRSRNQDFDQSKEPKSTPKTEQSQSIWGDPAAAAAEQDDLSRRKKIKVKSTDNS